MAISTLYAGHKHLPVKYNISLFGVPVALGFANAESEHNNARREKEPIQSK